MGRHTTSELPPPINRKPEKRNDIPQSSGRPACEERPCVPDASSQGGRQEEESLLTPIKGQKSYGRHKSNGLPWLDPQEYRRLEAEAMTAYRANPGSCPVCGRPIVKGIVGHLAKCLRIQKSKTESIQTT